MYANNTERKRKWVNLIIYVDEGRLFFIIYKIIIKLTSENNEVPTFQNVKSFSHTYNNTYT